MLQLFWRQKRHGASSVEYAGLIAIVAVLLAAVVPVIATNGGSIAQETSAVVECHILRFVGGGGGCANQVVLQGAAPGAPGFTPAAPPAASPLQGVGQWFSDRWSDVSSWWATTPPFVQGLVPAALGALTVAAVIGAGAILIAGAPVWATIGVIAATVGIVGLAGGLAVTQGDPANISFGRMFLGGMILAPPVMGLVAAAAYTGLSGLTVAGLKSATTLANVFKTLAPFWPLVGAGFDMLATGEWSWQKAGWALAIGLLTLPISYVSSSKFGAIQAVGSALNVGLNQAWNFIRERVFGIDKVKQP